MTTAQYKARADELMKQHGYTYTALAAHVGISATHLSDLLLRNRGRSTLKYHGPKIAEALGVPVEELFPELAADGSKDA